MPKDKKRLSKNAKAALKAVTESKTLASVKAVQAANRGNFKNESVTAKTSTAIKPRPDKKRG